METLYPLQPKLKNVITKILRCVFCSLPSRSLFFPCLILTLLSKPVFSRDNFEKPLLQSDTIEQILEERDTLGYIDYALHLVNNDRESYPQDTLYTHLLRAMDLALMVKDTVKYFWVKYNLLRFDVIGYEISTEKAGKYAGFIEELKQYAPNPDYLKVLSHTYLDYVESAELPEDSSIYYYTKILELQEIVKDSFLIILVHGHLSYLHNNKGNHKACIEYGKKAVDLIASQPFHNLYLFTYTELSDCLIKNDEVAEAQKYLEFVWQYLTASNSKINEKYFLLDLYREAAKLYEKLQNYERAFSIQKMYQELYESEQIQNLSNDIEQLQVKLETQEKENQILSLDLENKKASRRYNQLLLFLLLSITGSLIAFFFFRQKQRYLAREAKQLKALDQAKNRLYTNITHEFRTPLTIIKGMADEISGPKKAKVLIQKNSNRLLRMVNQMLLLARLESKTMAIQWKQGNVIPFLKYLTESCDSIAIVKHQSLAFFAKEENLVMDYDEEKLQQILINLLTNAIKFTPKYGHIKVIAERIVTSQGAALRITVADTGKGIPRDKLPHIFDRFYQVDDSTVRQEEGSGIGLALVKQLVDLLGGQIQVQSKVEKGTQFKVDLPIKLQSKDRIKQEWGTGDYKLKEKAVFSSNLIVPPIAQSDEKPLVLAIEDNTDLIAYLATILQEDYQFQSAQNGKAGLTLAKKIVPDVIICDVMMPEMDGFEVCRHLKAGRVTSHIPVVMLTAKVTQGDKVTGLSQGADAYLTKPFDKTELLARLKNLTLLSQRLRERLNNPATSDHQLDQKEAVFLAEIHRIIEANLDNELFNIPFLCKAIRMSRAQLYRKFKAVTGDSVANYIRKFRLQRAKKLLETSDKAIGEIAAEVGFKDFSHFSRSYQQAFGESPSESRK